MKSAREFVEKWVFSPKHSEQEKILEIVEARDKQWHDLHANYAFAIDDVVANEKEPKYLLKALKNISRLLKKGGKA